VRLHVVRRGAAHSGARLRARDQAIERPGRPGTRARSRPLSTHAYRVRGGRSASSPGSVVAL